VAGELDFGAVAEGLEAEDLNFFELEQEANLNQKWRRAEHLDSNVCGD
jgi:hypothetical protein